MGGAAKILVLLVNIQTELQLAFVMEVVLLRMRAEAVQERLILRRYFFGQFCSQLCLLKQSGGMVDYLKAWQSVVAVEKKKLQRHFWIYVPHFSKINNLNT